MCWSGIRIPSIIVMIFLGLGLSSCEGPEGPQGPQGPSALMTGVYGEVAWGWWSATINAEFEVFESPSIPTVQINGIPCQRQFTMYGDGFKFYGTDLPLALGDSVHIIVNYLKPDGDPEVIQSDIILPGPFAFTAPDTSDDVVISVGDSLMVSWTESSGADVYSVDFSFRYNYFDTLGGYQVYTFELDTLITETAITFGSELLFPNPALIDSIVSYGGNGWFNVWAKHGPWREGDPTNVYGDGIGTFYGRTFGGHLTLFAE